MSTITMTAEQTAIYDDDNGDDHHSARYLMIKLRIEAQLMANETGVPCEIYTADGIVADVVEPMPLPHASGDTTIYTADGIPVSLTPMSIDDVDPALIADLDGDNAVWCWLAIEEGAAVSNQCYHIVYSELAGRGGIVFVGSGSSGLTSWTDAHSHVDVLARYLVDDMSP